MHDFIYQSLYLRCIVSTCRLKIAHMLVFNAPAEDGVLPPSHRIMWYGKTKIMGYQRWESMTRCLALWYKSRVTDAWTDKVAVGIGSRGTNSQIRSCPHCNINAVIIVDRMQLKEFAPLRFTFAFFYRCACYRSPGDYCNSSPLTKC